MANPNAYRYFAKGAFDSKKFVRDMQDTEQTEIQEQYRQALAEFIVITRERVDILIRARSEILMKVEKRNPGRVAGSGAESLRIKGKERRQLQDIQSKIEQQRYAVRHWILMNTKFNVTLDEVAARVGLPEGSSFNTMFPELFAESS